MEQFYIQLMDRLLGELPLVDYVAGMIFALIGAFLSLRIHAKNRNKISPNTPNKFDWTFLIQDNAQRLFTGFLVTFIAFRFAPQILQQDYSIGLAFVVGFSNDRIAGLISKFEVKARE